jgi:queuine tRNA-ribosyltransferase
MFGIISQEKNKRRGLLATKSGEINTPFFMPDATRGLVKSLGKDDLESIGVGPMVVNTYHLYLEPGVDLIRKAGGINKFMNWPYSLLSDSGGYQVFSLIHKNPKLGKITSDKVVFRSPLNGTLHELTPEKSIQIQFDLDVDMMVALDDCPPNNYPKEKIKASVERTIKWAQRCKAEYEKQLAKRNIKDDRRPLIFGVIQGGEHLDLRKYCAEELIKIGWDGLGFGARHHDEKGNFMEDLLEFTANLIPQNYLRFALGVGTPQDIIRCINFGWDMFDCVIPTREGRHGRIFIRKGELSSVIASEAKQPLNNKKEIATSLTAPRNDNLFYETININNEKFKTDFTPVDKNCDCELCRSYSRAYLHHLFAVEEPLAMRLASIHNLKFYLDLMRSI